MHVCTPKERNTIKNVFEFVKQFESLNRAVIQNIDDREWFLSLNQIDDQLPGVSKWNPEKKCDGVVCTVKRLPFPLCPVLPHELAEWIIDETFNQKEPTSELPSFKPSILVVDEVLGEDNGNDLNTIKKNRKVLFEESDQRVKLGSQFVEKYKQWTIEYKSIEKAHKLFNQLLILEDKLEHSNLKMECVAGNFMFASKATVDRKAAKYPLVTIPVDIVAEPGDIPTRKIVLRSGELCSFNQSVLQSFAHEPFVKIEAFNSIANRLNLEQVHPYYCDEIYEHIKQNAVLFSSECKWVSSDEVAENIQGVQYKIYYEPCLVLQNRPSGIPQAIDKIQKSIDDTNKVPQHLVEIICEDVPMTLPPEETNLTEAEQIARTAGEDPEILLTKPANKEQLNIAKKIAHCNSLLVQGPPGTGKTHTIANLLGHFLSEGKRILVTSEKVKALTVLKEKLPKKLQGLCVSKLQDRKDLENTVNELGDTLSSLSLRDLKETIIRTSQSRAEIVSALHDLRTNIYLLRKKDFEGIVYAGQSYSLDGLAKKLRNEERLGKLIPGQVIKRSDFMSQEELVSLYSNNGRWTTEEIDELKLTLPSSNELPNPEWVRRVHKRQLEVEKEFNDKFEHVLVEDTCNKKGEHLHVYSVGQEEPFGVLTKHESSVFAINLNPLPPNDLHGVGLRAYIAGMTPGSIEFKRFSDLVFRHKTSYEMAVAWEAKEFDTDIQVELKGDYSVGEIEEASQWFKEHCPSGTLDLKNKIFSLFNKSASLFNDRLSCVYVNGERPKSVSDFEAVIEYCHVLKEINNFISLWNKLCGENYEERVSFLDIREFTARFKTSHFELENGLNWWSSVALPYLNSLEKLDVQCSLIQQALQSSPCAEKMNLVIRLFTKVHQPLNQAENIRTDAQQYQNLKMEYLSLLRPLKNKSCLALRLYEAIESHPEDYEEVFSQLCYIERERPAFQQYEVLLEKLGEYAPDLKVALEQCDPEYSLTVPPSDIYAAWEWHQLNYQYQERTKFSIKQLEAQVASLSTRQRVLTQELATAKAWYAVKRRLENDPQNVLGKLKVLATKMKQSSGKGKNVNLAIQAVHELLPKCQHAVPVWIMTITDALKNMNSSGKFDIVIIDEASQADITALPVLFMAEKVIVVGDDKQVTPSSIGKTIDGFNTLIKQYLQDVKLKQMYDSKLSIYELLRSSGCPSVMLTEHFRCVPEIIGWSRKKFYNSKIKPLRDATDSNLKPALVPWRVNSLTKKGNFVVEEANAAIKLIRSMMSLSEYDGKTFGIVLMHTLSASEMAQLYFLLHQEFSQKERQERQILCGSSAEFQGDERDVIIMCLMEVPPNDGEPLPKLAETQDGTWEKRFNVAVTRARDQIWLVHSFDPKSQLKSGDLRRDLFEWITGVENGNAFEEEVSLKADSPFETAVGVALKQRGYYFEQQHYVGGFRLDFVVRSNGYAVALECDGETYHSSEADVLRDMERQCMLERNGWKFVRLRSSEYFRDPEAAIRRICDDMGKLNVVPCTDINQQRPTNLLKKIRDNLLNDKELLKRKEIDCATLTNNEGIVGEKIDCVTPEFTFETTPVEIGVVDIDGDALHENKQTLIDELKQERGQSVMVEKAQPIRFTKKTNEETSNSERPKETLSSTTRTETVKAKSVDWNGNGEAPKVAFSLGILSQEDEIRIIEEDARLWRMLSDAKIQIVDKRSAKRGNLWVIGGTELRPIMTKVKDSLGLHFIYCPGGGKATHHKPSWWLANKYRGSRSNK